MDGVLGIVGGGLEIEDGGFKARRPRVGVEGGCGGCGGCGVFILMYDIVFYCIAMFEDVRRGGYMTLYILF